MHTQNITTKELAAKLWEDLDCTEKITVEHIYYSLIVLQENPFVPPATPKHIDQLVHELVYMTDQKELTIEGIWSLLAFMSASMLTAYTEKTDQKYLDIVKKHQISCDSAVIRALNCAELMDRKQRDYGRHNISKFGEIGCLIRASDKIERIKNILQKNTGPSNESLIDSYKDLYNYAIIALIYRNGAWFGDYDKSLLLPFRREVCKCMSA